MDFYVSIYDDSAFGDGFEEICFREPTVIIEIKEFECFEQERVHTDFWRGLELNFMQELGLKSCLRYSYAAIVSDMISLLSYPFIIARN